MATATQYNASEPLFWEKSYPTGVSSRDPLPAPEPVEALLENAALRWPDEVALDFYDHTITYRQLWDLAARAAKGFQTLGVGPGINVGLHLLNTPHYVICAFGILMAGGRVINFNHLAPMREMKYQLADTNTQIMVTLDRAALYPQIALLKGSGSLETVVVCSLEDFLPASFAQALGGAPVERQRGSGCEIEFSELVMNEENYTVPNRGPLEEEIAVIAYSGGTTGDPKGVMLTHANFSAMVNISVKWTGKAIAPSVRKTLVVLPLCHIFGFGSMMLIGVATGAELVLHLRFDVNRVVADLSGKKIAVFAGVPAMYLVLLGHSKIKEVDLSALKYCFVGGAPMPADVLKRFKELTGVTPQVSYALTETTAIGTMQVVDRMPPHGTSGLPLPHTHMELVDIQTGTKVLPVGEIGEICCTGPHIMKGYWNKPEETEKAFYGGRFHTGDIGFLDEDGYLTLVDRKKDMIITGGYNVFPQKIEKVLCEHPTISSAAVIGIPDPNLGQLLKAFLELKPGSVPFTYEDLNAFLADKIATYEMPSQMEIRSSLPKSHVGKLSKRELIAEELSKQGRPTDPSEAC